MKNARAETPRSPRRRHEGRARALFIVSFLAPAVLLYAWLVIFPLVQAIVFSLYRWRGVSQQRTFIRLENFEKLLSDGAFFQAVKNNLTLLLVAGVVIVFAAVGLAHAMGAAGRMGKALRSIYLFPQVISLVVVAILWMFLFNPSFGLINAGLKAVGLPAPAWLGSGGTALVAVGVAFVWHALGFFIMLFAAGLSGIPGDVKEAAELDGSTGWHRFWKVTWPMLWSIKRVATIYLVINVMNVFTLVFLMTEGGNPDRATETMLTYLYEQGFQNYQFGYATSVAVANFVITMALSLLVMLIFRRNPMEARTR